jgi:double-strand break repair protein MRE11
VGLLRITGRSFEIEKIRLKTVRPFIMDSVVLKNIDDLDPLDTTAVNAFLQEKVLVLTQITEMIDNARETWVARNPGVEFPKPLIRLKVACTD